MKKLALHWKILIGLVLGLVVGFLFTQVADGKDLVVEYIKPFGTIFINLLKLMAIPIIIASLIKGVSDLKDLNTLSSMGGRTLMLYVFTMVISSIIGLMIVNTVKPGSFLKEETRAQLMESFSKNVQEKLSAADLEKTKGALQPLVDIIPQNFIEAASSNGNMLQVIFFVILFGIGLIMVPADKAKPVKDFFESLNEVTMKMIDIIMQLAPYGVFALMAALVVESPSPDIFSALGVYCLCVILGLLVLIFVFYPPFVRLLSGMSPVTFYKGLSPAQLVAFSTSSSAATLPVTMECVQERLGVDEEVTSFVLPVGATVNMDGTCLYQSVATVFIAQVFGNDLTLADQISIIITATLASIGSAAVPGAGMIMLVIVLEAVGVDPAGIALIFAVDRPLDMMRTVCNVTGDAAVAVVVGKQLGKLRVPKLTES